MKMTENKTILELLQRPGNDKCADCCQPGPLAASYNLGVFLCEQCSTIHQSIGTHISKVKSVKLGNWDNEQIQMLAKQGNIKARQKYEENVPLCYRRPSPKDPPILHEQWIRAKYERKEFIGRANQTYLTGHKEGTLWKRGKDDKHFQPRRFVLDATENTIKYFNKDNARDPKATMRLDSLNVMIVPDKVGNPNAMQIVFEQEGQTRNLFVYSDTAQDMVDWYTAIRSAKLNRFAIAYPGVSTDELCRMLARDFIKEGWLGKTGPRPADAYRRRWVTLDNRKLMYFEDPMDAFAKGEVFIGTSDKGFELKSGIQPGTKDAAYGFYLVTPDRNFQFSADTEQDQKEWITAIRQVINIPLSPQDSSSLFRSTSVN